MKPTQLSEFPGRHTLGPDGNLGTLAVGAATASDEVPTLGQVTELFGGVKQLILLDLFQVADVNALAADSRVAVNFSDKVPAGKRVTNLLLRVLEAFDSDDFTISGSFSATGDEVLDILDTTKNNALGDYTVPVMLNQKNGLQSFYLIFNWGENVNPQDYSHGEITVFIQTEDFPDLSL